MANSGDRFSAGHRFLELITFLGCSPHIEISPSKDEKTGFCYVQIAVLKTGPEYIAGGLTNRQPRCSHCRDSVPQWRTAWKRGGKNPNSVSVTCPSCGTSQALTTLHWPKDTGFAQFYLLVENIFPGEAVPVPELMALLGKFSGCDWRYFHILR